MVRVRILIVGDEILSGRTRDANGGWLAERLDALGHDVTRIVVCPDDPDVIVHELEAATADAPVVVVTGGLGPTHDDRTTAAVARFLGRRVVVDEDGWRRLQARYAKRFGPSGAPPADLVESARKMVTIPEDADALPNPVGAASGYVAARGGARLVVLPGVPRELTAMFDAHVVDRVLPAVGTREVRELHVALPEAGFARLLEDVSREFPDVAVGSYPRSDELRVVLRFKGEPARADAARDAVRRRVGDGHVLAPD